LDFDLPFVERIFAVRKYLYQHYRETLNMGILTKHAGINENNLRQGFMEIFGLSPAMYLESIRIEEVLPLLEKKSQLFTIETVFREVGFNSYETFLRVFKKHKGLTPVEWRKKAPFK
jgi:AraC-like DNA-binding protein